MGPSPPELDPSPRPRAPEEVTVDPQETGDHRREESREDEHVAQLLTGSLDVAILAEAVARQEAADAADTLEYLEDEDAADVLVAMDEQAAAMALAEMELVLAGGVIEDLIDEDLADYAARLLGLMAPDDAADLLQSTDDDEREVLYRAMPADVARKLRRLVGYDQDSAGGLMTTNFVALDDAQSVHEATELIRHSGVPEEVHEMPVVNADGRLVGTIGLRDILLHRAEKKIGDLMERSPRAVRVEVDREEVAMEFDRYDRHMVSVVDAAGRLLGIVTVDDVIDIIRAEHTEDVQKTVGAGGGEAVYSGVLEKFRGRFPWLVVSLVMMVPSAWIILQFEDLIGDLAIIAVLMPIVAALAGNAGHQALAVTLRGIVLEEVRPDRVWPLIRRETIVGCLTGCAIGSLVGAGVAVLAATVPDASWRLGLVVGVSMAMSMCTGTLAGSTVPLLMRRFGADPAQSSAIFLIMVTDGMAFLTFLGLTYLTYGWLVATPGIA